MLEKTLESPLDCKEIQPVHPKGDQSWVFIGRSDVETETPILWPPNAKKWLICKDPDAGKDWRQEEKGMTEGEMVGWHHWWTWTWVWVDSGIWWWTGRPGMLWFMVLQKVGHNWATEMNWTELMAIETKVIGILEFTMLLIFAHKFSAISSCNTLFHFQIYSTYWNKVSPEELINILILLE